MRKLVAALLFLAASVAIVVSEVSNVEAATNQGSCSHFSENYSPLNCFFSGSNGSGGSGGGGGSGTHECPGGGEASCVECDGGSCQWACSGGLSCKFYPQPGGERMCATSRVCRTL
jgi:hypothetical protein